MSNIHPGQRRPKVRHVVSHVAQRLPATLLFLVLVSSLLSFLAKSVCAQNATRKVLVLASDDQYIPANKLINEAIRSTMKKRSAAQVSFFYEALDSFRLNGEKYENEFVELLRRKYDGENIELIYVLGPPALRFLSKHQDTLFTGTPIVYIVLDQNRLNDLALGPNVTGVSGKVELQPTLDLALTIQPETKKVVVVTGQTQLEAALVQQAHEEFRPYEGKVEFDYIVGPPLDELEDKLSELPANTIVFYLGFSTDKTGQTHSSPEVLSFLMPSCSAPIYGASEILMGLGIVGGRLIDFDAMGTRAAEMGLHILAGEKPQNIPRQVMPNTTMFDWRQLHRWGISERRIPAGSVIRFREATFWEQYKWRIIGVISLLIFESILIVFLLVQRSRRRIAEKNTERFAKLLEAQHRRLDEVVSNVPGVVWETRIDPVSGETKTAFVSRYVQKMLGFGEDDFKDRQGFGLSLVPEEERERVKTETNEILVTKGSGTLQFPWVTKDGRSLWVEAHLAVITDESGEAIGLRGVTMDITDRQHAEASLRESEQRLRLGLQAGRMIAWDWDPSIDKLNTVGDVNEIYGTDPVKDGAQGLSILHPEDLSHHQSIIDNVLVRGGTYQSEFRIVRPDSGAVVWIEERGEAVVNGNGKAKKLTGVVMDITERRRSEEALRVSEARFRIMADSAPVMIWMAGPDQRNSYFNQGWLNFTGRSIEQELGTGWTEIVFADDYVRFMDRYLTAFQLREPFQIELRLRRADGVYRWIYDCGAPRFSSEGEFLGYIGSCIDISDRKEAEEALQNAHQEVSKLKNQLEAENVYLREEIKLAHNVNEIIGKSEAINYVLFKIEQVCQTDTTVLILGETGTGKELVARAIHNQSKRRDRPLVKLNCAALSASLIESELFGHEKGAFTGATARKVGRFELADGATIFLDEIGELPLELQAKLLRVVQEGEFERLGSTKTINVDVRILAATNRILKDEVQKGTFREDLWYRLNVFPLTVPPLRQRKEDIPLMVEHFTNTFSRKIGKTISSISSVTLKKLKEYSWPGNVRELANVIERAVVNANGPVLHIMDHFEEIRSDKVNELVQTLEQVEKEYIVKVLDSTGWKVEGPSGAARVLGLNPSTLRTRMLKFGIQKATRLASTISESSR